MAIADYVRKMGTGTMSKTNPGYGSGKVFKGESFKMVSKDSKPINITPRSSFKPIPRLKNVTGFRSRGLTNKGIITRFR